MKAKHAKWEQLDDPVNQKQQVGQPPRSACGQKYLSANVRARVRGLNSRIRILHTALGRTRSFECSEFYGKAIRAAEFDIQELLA